MARDTKTLIYDIETSPNLGFVWGKYEQDVIAYKEEWYMLCFAYKWLGEKSVKSIALPDFKLYKKEPTNDREVVKKLHELFNEAEILVAHNGDTFDQKKSHARFIFHDLPPPSPYKSVDTRKVSRKYFMLNSNKLDDIGDTLKIGRKAQTGGFNTWLGCMNGDPKSWKTMRKYNKQDIVLLEQVYLRLRPWIQNHPPLVDGRPDNCPKCGEGPLQSRGITYTRSMLYNRFQCVACRGWCRARVGDRLKPSYI